MPAGSVRVHNGWKLLYGRRKTRVFEEAAVGKGVEKSRELPDLVIGQGQAVADEQGIGGAGFNHAPAVMQEYVEQAEETAIVPVRCGNSHIAEGWHFEFEGVAAEPGNVHAPFVFQVIVHWHTGIAVAVIGEQGFGVARGALGFKDAVAQPLGQIETVFAGHDAVVLAVAAHHAQQELAEGLVHVAGVDGAIAKGGAEEAAVVGVGPEFPEHVADGLGHFVVRGKRGQRLQVEVVDAAIVHQFLLPGEVLQRGRVARGEGVIVPVAEVVVEIGKSGKLLVAAGTGKIAVFAQPAVVKQFFAKGNAFLREWVLPEIVYRLRPPFGHHKRYGMGAEGGLPSDPGIADSYNAYQYTHDPASPAHMLWCGVLYPEKGGVIIGILQGKRPGHMAYGMAGNG